MEDSVISKEINRKISAIKIIIPMSIIPVIGRTLRTVAWTGIKVITHFPRTLSIKS